MTEQQKIRRYEAETMALPPLRMVLGEVPSPDPERRDSRSTFSWIGPRPDTTTVLRIIARLKEEK